jgi:hypothetical protein
VSDAEWLEFQKLAAQLARACEMISAADKLAEEMQHILDEEAWRDSEHSRWRRDRIKAVLDAYKVVRQGQ